MPYINLPCGRRTLVDRDIYLKYKDWNWHSCGNRRGYVQTIKPGNVRFKLHRLIMNAPKGMEVDHINLDTLDNRRRNLRLATHAQNGRNALPQRNSSNKHKGVRKVLKRWTARTSVNGKEKHLGTFDTQKEAVLAYNAFVFKTFGEYAWLNPV